MVALEAALDSLSGGVCKATTSVEARLFGDQDIQVSSLCNAN